MVNPVELIGRARRRLTLIAATDALLYALAPAVTAFALALAMAPLDEWTRARLGYGLTAPILANLRAGLIAAGLIDLGLCAALARRAWLRADDFATAAERVDALVGARQEVLTFATFTDPSRASAKSERTALFPILWRRAAAYLAQFDPERAFRFEIGAPLRRGSMLALATLVFFGLVMMALVRPPSPEAGQARRLREIAREIESSSAGGESQALAKALRETAAALENPKLPPEQKLKMLAEVTREVEQPPVKPPESGKGNQSGKGNAAGKGDSGNGGEGQGSGKGKGAGKGSNPEGTGSSEGKKNGPEQIAEIKKELSEAKAKIESASAPKENSMPKPSAGEKNGSALRQGENPNQSGPAPNAAAENKLPKQGESGPQTEKTGEGGKQSAKNDKGSTKGDTHLGQFPEPVRYERFFKPGEHGPPIELRDARYVLFRLPAAMPSGGGGKTVVDAEHPAASTPYSNVPLKAERLEAAPDERQPVPPRYRDLIQ